MFLSTPMLAQSQPLPAPDLFRAALNRLVEAGMEIVEEAVALAQTPALPETKARLVAASAAAYDKVGRAVRRTILLANHLDRAAQRRIAVRKRILRETEDRIHREQPSPELRERQHAELLERLDSPDLLEEIETRPADAVLADILRDLGLERPLSGAPLWRRRTPSDIALLRERAINAAQPPSPGTAAEPAPDPATDPHDPPDQLQHFLRDFVTRRLE